MRPRNESLGSAATSPASAASACGATPDFVDSPPSCTWMHTASGGS